jgi:hypothetical protein
MKKAWQTIKGYIWWNYPRGSFHYDVMVTLILLFIFVTPYFIRYADKPASHPLRDRSVLVKPDGQKGFILLVDARGISGRDAEEKQSRLVRVIEPIVGQVKIDRWAAEEDDKGNIVAYRVWVRR